MRLRRNGYRNALAAAGLEEPDGFYLPGDLVRGLGPARRSQSSFAAGASRPTRSSAATTRSRAAPSTRCASAAYRVPEPSPIVGFDNWEVMAEATRPPLTSVDMNLSDLGREAGAHLLEMIAGKPSRGVHRLPCTLVVRESCGAQRQNRLRQQQEQTKEKRHASLHAGQLRRRQH